MISLSEKEMCSIVEVTDNLKKKEFPDFPARL